MKQRLDSPLCPLKGKQYRKLRRIHKRWLGRANRWPRPFPAALMYEMYQMSVDFCEHINVMLWSYPPTRPRPYRRRAK